MAAVHHERAAEGSRRGNIKPSTALPHAKRAPARLFVTRAIWILTGILLGAAAGWTVFRAFLILITLD